jgi:uncharacterized protein YerC
MKVAKGPKNLISIEAALVELKDLREARSFLSAVLSTGEYQKLRKRWKAYQLRARGIPLERIKQLTGVSMTTASRAAKLRLSRYRIILDILISRAIGDAE